MSNDRRIYRRLLIGFLVAMAGLTFFSGTITTITLPRVRTESPTRGSLVKVVEARGRVQPRATAVVHTNQHRKVRTVAVGVGRRVMKGQILALLDLGGPGTVDQDTVAALLRGEVDPEDLCAALVRAATATQALELEQSDAGVGRAATRLEDVLELHEAGIEPGDAVRSAEEALAAAILARERATQALQAARNAALDAARDSILTAPESGRVRDVNLVVGAYPDAARAAFVLVRDTLGYDAVVDVSGEQAELLPIDTRVEVRLPVNAGKATVGRVTEIRDTPDGDGDMRQVVIALDPDPAIRGGERADIYVAVRSEVYPTLVANAAVSRDSQGPYLWIQAARRPPRRRAVRGQVARPTPGQRRHTERPIRRHRPHRSIPGLFDQAHHRGWNTGTGRLRWPGQPCTCCASCSSWARC